MFSLLMIAALRWESIAVRPLHDLVLLPRAASSPSIVVLPIVRVVMHSLALALSVDIFWRVCAPLPLMVTISKGGLGKRIVEPSSLCEVAIFVACPHRVLSSPAVSLTAVVSLRLSLSMML